MTIKELANDIGCSRATLDRVLNNRGIVNEKTRARILKKIDDLGFEVNSTGKILALQNKLKFGIIVSSDLVSKNNLLFELIYEGMRIGEKTLSNTGAKFYFITLKSGCASEQIDAIHTLMDEGVTRIAISIEENTEELYVAIDEALNHGIGFITYFNSASRNILKSRYVYCLSSEHKLEGEIAAGLIGRFLDGKGKVVLLSGLMKNSVHQDRIDSAYTQLKTVYPDIEIIDVLRNAYPEERIYETLDGILKTHHDLKGVIASCGGNWLIPEILSKHGMTDQVRQVVFDLTPKIQEALRHGMIDAAIGVDLRKLGYNTIVALVDSLVFGKVDAFKVDLPVQVILGGCYPEGNQYR